jgi:hypothetical protein
VTDPAEDETIRILPVRREVPDDDRTAFVERYRPPVPPRRVPPRPIDGDDGT